MKFSIITPSFRSSRWLELCIPSVADQEVELEHIVQDGGSDDGTLEWLTKDSRVTACVESDQGMYDAVNRGLKRASGDVLAYLNCDEQYLPGALKAVGEYFARHPGTDVVFADAIVVEPDGQYICHRRALLPTRHHSLVSFNLSILTCATFFRRRLIAEKQLFFNPRYRVIGDAYWVLELLKQRVAMAVLPRFTTAFADTGANLSLQPNAERERQELLASAPRWARALRRLIVLKYRLRKLLAGHYTQPPFEYAIYTDAAKDKRRVFKVEKPTAVWKSRL